MQIEDHNRPMPVMLRLRPGTPIYGPRPRWLRRTVTRLAEALS